MSTSDPRLFAASCACLAFVSLAVAPRAVHADNPYDEEQRRLGARASAQGRSADGILPLLELWHNADWADPAVTQSELERLSRDTRLSAPRRAYAEMLLARSRLQTGDVTASREAIRDLGYVTAWRVIGSFDNEGKRGLDEEMGPEAVRSAPWDPDARYQGREREVTWRAYPAETSRYGYVNFDALFRPYANVCGYAETFVMSERDQPLSLWLGAGGAVKVWWNGELAMQDARYREPHPDRHVVPVAARAGANRLLVKVCVAEGRWGFYLRVGDARGAPSEGVTADATYHDVAPSGRARPPRGLVSDLDHLERAATGARPAPVALERLARFLRFTGADDPAEQRARDLAARAAEADPTVERLELAAQLATERGDAQRFGNLAFERFPSSREARVLRARVLAGGPSPELALPILRELGDASIEGLEGVALHARLLRGLALNDSARRLIEDLAPRMERSPGWLLERVAAAEAAERQDEAATRRRELVALRFDHVPSRRALALDAVRRGQTEEATAQLDALDQLLPDDARSLRFIADLYEGLADTDQAASVLQRAHALAPEDASILATIGRFQLRLDQPAAAADSLRAALALQPQDAVTRELLEQIDPGRERADERFAVAPDALLARRVERAAYPTTVLADLTVNTVYPNGLGSSFVQFAAQVHDREGARQLRTYSIQFDPDSQRVDIRQARVFRADGSTLEATQTFEQQLGEPWYRIYYDTRALVVVFPDLRPGDTVELQYRTDDVTHRNLFADYYGDMHFLQRFAPIARLDYILITPESRPIYFNDPGLSDLQHEQTVRDGQRVDRFWRESVPAIHSEQNMPGMTEIAPYLHVSTYRTWEEVGRWWWGLIQDQLQIDDNLRRVVRELVTGAPDVDTKVRRIHEWVIRNTRYVGLEFGIHGFKPYRMPLIVQRGFGDCKDKASLMYAMFREAGIDARIVLVRTRRNGAITDLPASLAVFDHAIAYVPELDLYIDGTAEFSGMRELPPADQGVTVLVVGPNEARLTRTPVLPASANHRERSLTAEVGEDGAAEIEVTERIVGSDAASYREQYEAAGTREERFERSLRTSFPGLVLDSQGMRGLSELSSEIELEYSARAPSFATPDGDGLRVDPSMLTDLLRSLAPTATRRYPLDLGQRRSYREDRVVEAPRGWSIAGAPTGGAAESDFGRLRLSFEQEGGRVRARTELELNRDHIAPEEYPSFRRWVEQAEGLMRQRVQLERGAR